MDKTNGSHNSAATPPSLSLSLSLCLYDV
jgi:hypothetical protein